MATTPPLVTVGNGDCPGGAIFNTVDLEEGCGCEPVPPPTCPVSSNPGIDALAPPGTPPGGGVCGPRGCGTRSGNSDSSQTGAPPAPTQLPTGPLPVWSNQGKNQFQVGPVAVNASTGNLAMSLEQQNSGPFAPQPFLRYNSKSISTDSFGFGWFGSFRDKVNLVSDSDADLISAEGGREKGSGLFDLRWVVVRLW